MNLITGQHSELQKSPLNFDATPNEYALFSQIAQRGVAMARERAQQMWDYQQCMMDIAACHCNGTPLKLMQLLLSSDMDFAKDFAGICQNIDRSTGKLMNGFVPFFKADARF